MKTYLIDTNTCIYYINGKTGLDKKFEKAGAENCFISEITLAELKFGVENSEQKEKNKKTLDDFLAGIKVLPIINALDVYAKEKARLRRKGNLIDDFDLLIGATAISNNLILVTNNTRDFDRINGIILEDWTK